MLITVVADDMPDGDFYKKAPELEDAYFNLLFDRQNVMSW